MIGIMIELKSKCPACGGTIAVNALVPKAACPQCGKMRELDLVWWNTMLGHALEDGPKLTPGKRSKWSNLSLSADMTCGRFDPKFPGTTKVIDMEAAAAGAADGRFVDPKTGKSVSMRPVPDEYRELIPGVKCLVCEDLDHPATKIVTRWYLWHDERHAPFEWEGEVTDVVAGGEGYLYLALEPRFYHIPKATLRTKPRDLFGWGGPSPSLRTLAQDWLGMTSRGSAFIPPATEGLPAEILTP